MYSEDPKKNKHAQRLDRLTYDQAMDNKIGVMDRSALLFCGEHSIPIRVFSLVHPKNIQGAIRGDPTVGSMIQDGDDRTVLHQNYLKRNAGHKSDVSHWESRSNDLNPSPSYPLL